CVQDFSGLSCYRHPRDLHSFPTRRSSDLQGYKRRTVLLVVKNRMAMAERPPAGVLPGQANAHPGRRQGREGERLRGRPVERVLADRKSTRLNSSHVKISYAVFCLKKKMVD